MTSRIPLVVCLAAGLIMFLQYFSAHPVARGMFNQVNDWWQIIFAFTLFVGVAAFINNSLKAILRGKERLFKTVSLLGLIGMPFLAITGGTKIGSPFLWAFDNLQAPMQATVFSLLAFFVASASFRGFRARNLQATILLAAALIVLLGRMPITTYLSDALPELTYWVQDYPSMAARRAILIGIGLGSMTTALRVILGLERTYLRWQ